MTVSGETFAILNVLWKVFLTVITLHLCFLVFAFFFGSAVSGKNPFTLMKNQIPAYLSALYVVSGKRRQKFDAIVTAPPFEFRAQTTPTSRMTGSRPRP